jgi:predicted ribonuclease YlaK
MSKKRKGIIPTENGKEFFIRERYEYNEKQQDILSCSLKNKNLKCVLIDGIFGSAKSYLSVLIGLKLLKEGRTSKIVFIRNPVESSSTSKLGALPGTAEEKMAPYNEILNQKLNEFLTKSDIEALKKQNKIECIPLGFCRGLNWENCFVLVDESASLTFDDIILLMSRCAEHTKIFFIGDSINQNDIGSKSGFRKMFELLSDKDAKDNGVYTFELQSESDIVRSGFVRYIMKKTGKIKF